MIFFQDCSLGKKSSHASLNVKCQKLQAPLFLHDRKTECIPATSCNLEAVVIQGFNHPWDPVIELCVQLK